MQNVAKAKQGARFMTFDEFVSVKYFHPNFEMLVENIVERLALPKEQLPTCLYMNPLVTVECDLVTSEFYEKADKARGEWCQRARLAFGRHSSRSVRSWAPVDKVVNREGRYWHRAACLTGLMFVNDRFVTPGQWSRRGVTDKKAQGKRQLSHQEICEKLLELTHVEYWKQRFVEAGLTDNFNHTY